MVVVKHTNSAGSGLRCGLHFHDGKAISEHPLTEAQRYHFCRWGFTIEGDEAPKTKKGKNETEGGNP